MQKPDHIFFPPAGSQDSERIFSVEVGEPSKIGIKGKLFLRPSSAKQWPFSPDEKDLSFPPEPHTFPADQMILKRRTEGEQVVVEFSVFGENLTPDAALQRLQDIKLVRQAEGWTKAPEKGSPEEAGFAARMRPATAEWTIHTSTDLQSKVAQVAFEPDSGVKDAKPLAGNITFWGEGKPGEMTAMLYRLKEVAWDQHTHGWNFALGQKREVPVKEGDLVVSTQKQFTINFKGAVGQHLEQEDLLELLQKAQLATPGRWEQSTRAEPHVNLPGAA